MSSRTSPLKVALAGLCGPVTRTGRHSPVDRLAAAGLELRLYTPPVDFGDPDLEHVCRQAARRGLVLTDVHGKLVGGLQAVTTEILAGDDDSSSTALLR